jgi:hypothetical protein
MLAPTWCVSSERLIDLESLYAFVPAAPTTTAVPSASAPSSLPGPTPPGVTTLAEVTVHQVEEAVDSATLPATLHLTEADVGAVLLANAQVADNYRCLKPENG